MICECEQTECNCHVVIKNAFDENYSTCPNVATDLVLTQYGPYAMCPECNNNLPNEYRKEIK
jgi:hypothetical protein